MPNIEQKTKRLVNQPLYILASNESLGELQIMELKTLEWLEKLAPSYPKDISISAFFPDFQPIPLDKIKPFFPHRDWFLKKNHLFSIHGLRHILRVLFLNAVLSQVELGKIDPTLLISASVHDLRRKTDKKDRGHGTRAALWFKMNHTRLPFKIKSKNQLEEILLIVSSHELPSREASKLPFSSERILNIFKAADALDRYRLPRKDWWPKKEYIKIGSAKKMLGLARIFSLRSESFFLRGNLTQEGSVIKSAEILEFIKT